MLEEAISPFVDPVSGVTVYDPEGRLIPAGQYSSNDWQKLSNNNPSLTEALIKKRQSDSDAINAAQAQRTSNSMMLGLLGGVGANVALNETPQGQQLSSRIIDGVFDRYSKTYAPTQTYFAGQGLNLSTTAPSFVELERVPGSSDEVALGEMKAARKAFADATASPEGQKLYTAFAADDDPFKAAQKARIYKKLGFSAPDKYGMQRMDLRPGARQLGGLYQQGDRLMMQAYRNPERTMRLGRLGLGLGAAGLVAGAVRAGIGMINPLEDV